MYSQETNSFLEKNIVYKIDFMNWWEMNDAQNINKRDGKKIFSLQKTVPCTKKAIR